MQPNARIAAAIEILDSMLSEQPVERCLTTWARTHRFAGSSDRAAIRDAVFDAVRCQRSYAWLGGGLTGRGLMIGAMRAQGEPLDAVFTGQGHAPSELTEAEHAALPFDASDMPEPVRLDCPDWLWPMVTDAYPEMAVQILQTLQTRAPVFLRVNRAKATRSDAIATLAEDEIEAAPHKLSDTALEVTEGARRLRNARAYRDGLVELQDAASQAVVDQCLALGDSPTALDYCAGGGGKALALAAGGVPAVTAHDANPGRMSDLPDRAARAGATITNVETVTGTFDLVLCDAPCSGSGAWR
ncbi:MAG: RsmB/NOP family class I SAM-dependent RNA methyltransferase, partial [Pseudomonadota bacterium]